MRSRWLKKSFREGLCRYCVKLFVVFFTKIVSGEPATTHTVFFEKPSLYPVHLSKQLLRIIEFQIVKGCVGQAHSCFNFGCFFVMFCVLVCVCLNRLL